MRQFDEPACVIVKHANPCGVGEAEDLIAAWDGALAGDPVSAFGGVVSVTGPIDAALAEHHASLERRAEGWVLVDGGSVQGTYVDGDRVIGECRLDGPATLQLATVQLSFTPWGG